MLNVRTKQTIETSTKTVRGTPAKAEKVKRHDDRLRYHIPCVFVFTSKLHVLSGLNRVH